MVELLTHSKWRSVVVAVLFLAIQPVYFNAIYFTGDEPHYVLAADSLLRDGDFNVANNYREEHYRRYYSDPLTPQAGTPVASSYIPTEHGTGFPYLIAPAFGLGGVTAVRIQQAVCALLGVLLIAAAVERLTGDTRAATMTALLLAITPAWQAQMSRVYPDAPVVLLLGLGLYILARYSGSRVPFHAGFLVAFALGLTPILYLKFGVLALPFVVVTLLMPEFRRSPGIYAGAAAAVGLMAANIALNGWDAAIGGNFTQAANFQPAGAFGRYWAHWFDSHHGVFVHAPYTLLVFWAIVTCFRSKQTILIGLAASVAAFTVMHGFWIHDPGFSVPGRYFASMIPLVCMLVSIWAMQADRWRYVRLGAVAMFTLIPLGMLALSLLNRRSPDFMLRPYWTSWFPVYWESWHHTDIAATTADASLAGLLVIALVAASKFAATRRSATA